MDSEVQEKHRGLTFRYNNCQKKRSATALLAGSADSNKDFILLTEPYLGKRTNALFTKPWTINHSGPDSRAVIVSPPGVSSIKLSQFSRPDAAFNMVETSRHKFILGCAYFHDGIMDSDIWSPLLRDLSHLNKHILIMADTNAHSVLWGYRQSDAKAKKFEEVLTAEGFMVITSDYFASFRNSRGHESCIDVAFATPEMASLVSGRKTVTTTSLSDHTIWEILMQDVLPSQPQKRFKFKKANWDKIGEILKRDLMKITVPSEECDPSELDSYVDTFTNIIKAIMVKHIPRSKSHAMARWWTPELTSLMNSPQDKEQFENAIQNAKIDHWNNFDETSSSLGDAHLRRRLASLGPHVPRIATVEKEDGMFTTSNTETAEYLLDLWFRFPKNDPNKALFADYYEKTLVLLEKKVVEDYERITEEEILSTINDLRSGTAPGHDEIPVIVVKELACILSPHLAAIFNTSLNINHTPRIWKTGKVVLIPKQSGGYRPITLLPVFVKILERLVLRRLELLEVKEAWLEPEQFGFRPGHSCSHALLNYSTVAGAYLKHKTPHCFIHLDIKGAFDNVWTPVLLNRLAEINCPVYLQRWIADYMAHRRQFISVDGKRVVCNVQKSTPQGGSLSPLFWNMVINPLLQLVKPSVDFVQAYADDLVFSVTAGTWEEAGLKANGILDKIHKWMSQSRLSVNPTKSSVVLYTAGRSPPHIDIRLGSDSISIASQIKYLGVIFTRNLSWKAHVDYICGKAMKVLHHFSAIVRRNWGIAPRFIADLYKAAIEPIITHGAVAWCNATAVKARMKPLKRIQRLAARMAACVGNHVHLLDILNMVGFLPIDLRLQELAHVVWIKATNTQENPCLVAKERLRQHNTTNHFSALQQLQLWDRGLDLTTDMVQSESSKIKCKLKKPTPEVLTACLDTLSLAESRIGTCYYTDGSKSEEGTGAAFIKIVDGVDSESWTVPLHASTSVYYAELVAIEAALIDAQHSGTGFVRIYTDSLSALTTLSKPNTNIWIERIRMRLLRMSSSMDIKICWVRGHSGIYGNEVADQLAKQAALLRPVLPAMPLPFSEVKSRIKKQANQDWNEIWRLRRTSWAYNWLPNCSRSFSCPPMSNKLTNVFCSFVCGTSPLRGKLFQWKIVSSPDCHYHPGFRETPKHFLLDCDHHNDTRNKISTHIRVKTGTGDLTYKAIIENPTCVKILSEDLYDHLEEMRAFNNRLLVNNNGS